MLKKFYVFEGVDGSGKSTQIAKLKKALSKNYPTYDIINVTEPGYSSLGREIRNILLNSRSEISNFSEIMLFYSARFQMLEEVNRLGGNVIFLCDRFIHSSLVYQGKDVDSFALMSILNSLVKDTITPDAYFLLDVDDETIIKRNAKKIKDRMEKKVDMLEIAGKYRHYWDTNIENYRKINGNREVEEITEEILEFIIDDINKTNKGES